MLAKKIKYTDFNGVEREEEHLFNLTKAEIMEMELGTTGGFAESIQKLIETQDQPEIIRIFKDIILKSYGKKSADGREFQKSEEISKAFSYTNAYSELFMELATDDKAAAAFVNGIMPADLAKEAAKLNLTNNGISVVEAEVVE